MFHKNGKRPLRSVLIGAAAMLFLTQLAYEVFGQCVDHPDGETALRVNNQSSYDLTFFVDMESAGTVVPSKKLSGERLVDPGEHLLRAVAKLEGQELLVWSINEFPRGQVCTWTIGDPERRSRDLDDMFRVSNRDARVL